MNTIRISGLFLLLCLTVMVSLTLGKYPITLLEMCGYLGSSCGIGSMDSLRSALLHNILVDIRLPRILAAVLIGAALSVSGTAFQSMFINPLVSPSLLVPFNWFDRPPSYMRLLGIQWLANLLHPDLYSIDMVKETRAFYRLFIGKELSAREAQAVLWP